MSKIALEGNASGTGTLTIASQNTNSNYTLTLPNSTGTLVVTGGAQTIEFAAGTAAAPSITFTGDTNTGIFSPAADTIAFSEGGVESMRIDSSGNVGIGTSSPAAKLDVRGDLVLYQNANSAIVSRLANDSTGAAADSQFYVQNSANTLFFGLPSTGFSTSGLKVANTAYLYFDGANGINIGATNGSGPLKFYTGGTSERMRIDSSGKVGIGVSAPSTILHTSGSIITQGSGGNTAPTGQTVAGMYSSGSAAVFISGFGTTAPSTYQPIIFQQESQVGSAERARITSAGRFCINTTYSDTQLNIAYNGSSIRGVDINNTVSSNQDAIYFRTNGTNVGRINTDASNTSYVTSSDYRLKENVLPMTGALEKLAQLKPCTWTWKVNGAAGQGFIAHELQEVCPNAVVGEKDAIEIQRVEISPAVEATYDEDGNELTPAVEAVYEEREVPKYQGVDTSFLVATLTAAIQELKAITDAQATRIEALEAEVAALKGQ